MASDSLNEESDTPWHYDKRYSRFWLHYNTMMMTAHKDALVRARHVASHTSSALHRVLMAQNPQTLPGNRDPLRCRTSSHGKISSESSKSNRNRKKRKRKKRNRRTRVERSQNTQGVMSDSEVLQSQMSQGMHIEDEEETMEMDQDILDFLEQSEKHRAEWKIRKIKMLQGNNSESEDTEDNSKFKEHPDVLRSREMHELYGEASARIHAMETAMQLSFDRISTLYHPQYWPNIPFNVMYGGT